MSEVRATVMENRCATDRVVSGSSLFERNVFVPATIERGPTLMSLRRLPRLVTFRDAHSSARRCGYRTGGWRQHWLSHGHVREMQAVAFGCGGNLCGSRGAGWPRAAATAAGVPNRSLSASVGQQKLFRILLSVLAQVPRPGSRLNLDAEELVSGSAPRPSVFWAL